MSPSGRIYDVGSGTKHPDRYMPSCIKSMTTDAFRMPASHLLC
jgi:hypothetical protein